MGNYFFSILRVFGTKEERQKFVDYVTKRVPSLFRKIDPEKEAIPSKIAQWYDFKMWENEKGTFMTFFTNNTIIYYNEGYQLHKLFPELNFIYRSVDEGWPNHCGKWEFSPNDPISDELEKDLDSVQWIEVMLRMWPLYGKDIKEFFKMVVEKSDNDPQKAQRRWQLMQDLNKKNGIIDDSDTMNQHFANDKLFVMTQEELKNSPEYPECSKTWNLWKNPHDYDNMPIFHTYMGYNVEIKDGNEFEDDDVIDVDVEDDDKDGNEVEDNDNEN